jgi:acetyl/propionyl-CoA carboxylase alpha subunit
MAVDLAAACGLRNAATCEFLHDPSGAFYFLEVNTRLQVEHPVTELVAGLDIVVEQFHLAAGRPLSERALAAAAEAARPTSAAIELRLSAEDPARAFAPAPGRVERWVMPSGPGIRIDTAIEAGDRVPPEYDPMIAKLIVHAETRDAAIARLRRALDELEVTGIQTTAPFDRFVVAHPSFSAAELSTSWVEEHWSAEAERARAREAAMLAAALAASEASPPAGAPPTGAGRSSAPGAPKDGVSSWRTAGRVRAVDRWPA